MLHACITNECASACSNDKRMVPTVTANTTTRYLQAAAIAFRSAYNTENGNV